MAHAVYGPHAEPGDVGIQLEADESHHLVRVLRARTGDAVTVINGRGAVAEGIVRADGGRAVTVEVLRWFSHPQPAPAVALAQALPKGDRLDWILQKACELGVAEIDLVQARHSVSRMPPEGDRKRKRCQDLLVEACKQSLNPWLPALRWHACVADWLKHRSAAPLLYGHLGGDAVLLREWVRAVAVPDRVEVAIGPEGDFHDEELARLRSAGAIPVSLGPRVLRTETAALLATGILVHEWLDAGRSGV